MQLDDAQGSLASFPEHDNATSSEDEVRSDEEPLKDEIENELERLVFGDEVAFKDELKSYSQRRLGDDPPESNKDANDTLVHLDDEDVFFIDDGPGGPSKGALSHSISEADPYGISTQRGPPVWEDSDDDRMQVSLMSIPRLRKLRKFEEEDVISAKEYTKRLRRQYNALNPPPEWAKWDPAGKARKRPRNSEEADSGADVSSSDGMDVDESDFSVQPLTKLLQSNAALTRTNSVLPNKRLKLRSEVIAIERMKDISPTQPSAITSLSIHPHFPFILSSGLSSTAYLHLLKLHPTPPDTPNPLITSLHLKSTPLATCAWSPLPDPANKAKTPPTALDEHPKIYLSSRRRYFHTWTLPTGTISKTTRIYGQQATAQNTQRTMEVLKPSPCGRYIGLLGSARKGSSGVINILDATTQQWTAQARVEAHKGIADFAWWADGRGLCIVGRGGEASEWSIEQRRVLCRWEDEGAVGTTTMALGGGAGFALPSAHPLPPLGPDRWVAIGSTAGVVNVYDRHAWLASGGNGFPPAAPAPAAVLTPLTTPISCLVFSACGQLLVMASRWKRDALRLVHLPSAPATVGAVAKGKAGSGISIYRNWPTSKTPLGRVSAVALGELGPEERGDDSAIVLLVGNEAGVLRGWEITG